MKDEIIEKINENIRGERLLFTNKKIYSNEEKIAMLNSLKFGLKDSPLLYYYIHYGCFDKIVNICPKDYFNQENYEDQLILIYADCDKVKLTARQIEYNFDWNCFYTSNKFGTPNSELYASFIRRRLISLYALKSFFSFNIPIQDRLNDLNFIVTNNYLLTLHPEFYNEDWLNKLKDFSQYDLKYQDCNGMRNYSDVKRARKRLSYILKTK